MSGCRSATRLTMGMEFLGSILGCFAMSSMFRRPAQHPESLADLPKSAPERRRHSGQRASASSLDDVRTRGSRVEAIGEILRFVRHQSFAEFHDAHGIGRYAVIAEHEFSDPEIAVSDDPPDREALLVGLDEAAFLNVAPAADSFTGLRIIKHRGLAVDFMFSREIVRVRGAPVALQRCPHCSIVHLALPRKVPAIISGVRKFLLCRWCPTPVAPIVCRHMK